MRCKTHKRYKGMLRPKCSCLDCWTMYIERHMDVDIIEDSLEHLRKFHGCWSIEYGDENDTMVFHYLLDKKRELENDTN